MRVLQFKYHSFLIKPYQFFK